MSAFLAIVCFTLSPDTSGTLDTTDTVNTSGTSTVQTEQTSATETTVSGLENTSATTAAQTSAAQTDTHPASTTTTKVKSETSGAAYGVFEPSVIAVSSQEWYLTLVNTNYRLPEGYEPPKLTVVGNGCKLDSRVATHYTEMYNAAKKDGVDLKPYSGYRSYAKQKENYENKINLYIDQGYDEKEAAIKAATIIMPPGSSEHNLGFAMDIVCADTWFESTDEFTWLCDNGYKYGFILRYAKEKVDITGVSYEPWHWRYVGVKTATELYNMRDKNGVEPCLEEYLGKAD